MTTKPKLIYIVTQSELGGAQRYVFDLAATLSNQFDIVVAVGTCGEKAPLIEACEAQGIRTHKFKHLVRDINPLQDLAAISELAAFFKKETPRIIHLNSSKAGIIGALAYKMLAAASRQLPARLVYTVHGWVFNEPLAWFKKNLYLTIERIACRLHEKIIVLSKYDYDIAIEHKICEPEKLVIIPHGIKPILFYSREESQKILNFKFLIPDSRLLVGTIANLYKTKGITYLIDAAKELQNNGVNANFIVIGNGPEYKNCESEIKNYGLRNFYLVGSIPEAARYLKAFDAFVLPSVKEGMPYAILEAMQAGLPIVATSVGAIPEMLANEKNGLIVPSADSKALSHALTRVIQNMALRANLGNAARDTENKKFSFEEFISKTTALYK